jgi:hypothetical protein
MVRQMRKVDGPRVSPPALYTALVSLAALLSPWSGLRLGAFNAADVFLLASLLVGGAWAAVARSRVQLELWIWLPTIAVIPLLGRDVIVLGLDPLAPPMLGTVGEGIPPLIFAARVILSTLVVALCLALGWRSRLFLIRVVGWWWFGAVLSAAYAILQASSIAPELDLQQTVGVTSGRYPGLASHPNALAQASTLALIAPLLFPRKRGRDVVVGVGQVFLLASVVISGSRAGLLVGAVVLTLVIIRVVRDRRWWGLALPATPIVLALIVAVGPGLLAQTRLSESEGTAMSNIGRAVSIDSGVSLFVANPLLGSGLGSWVGELAPLIFLASGGIVLLAAYAGFIAGPSLAFLRTGARPIDSYVGLLVLGAILAFGMLNNGIFERYNFWVPLVAYFLATQGAPHVRGGESGRVPRARPSSRRVRA